MSLKLEKGREKRQFICGCGKEYYSNAALYTHVKHKHNGIAPSSISKPKSARKRGRPKKFSEIGQESDDQLEKENAEKQASDQKAEHILNIVEFKNFSFYKEDQEEKEGNNLDGKNKAKILKKGENQQNHKKLKTKNNINFLKEIFAPMKKDNFIEPLYESIYTNFEVYNYLGGFPQNKYTISSLIGYIMSFLREHFLFQVIEQTLLLIFLLLDEIYLEDKNELVQRSMLEVFVKRTPIFIEQKLDQKIKQLQLQEVFAFQNQKPTEILIWFCSFVCSERENYQIAYNC